MKQELIQDGTGNYLKVTGEAKENISDKIFSFQEIRGFLPLEIRWINGRKEYIYDISGRISLARYLSETIFTETEIRNIFLQIFEMAERLEEYLLDSNDMVIHEDFLYIEKVTGQIAGIFSQGSQNGNIHAMGNLLEYIMEKMNQEDRELVFFIYGMHKLTKGAGCTRSVLKDYVKEKNERPPQQQKELVPEYEPFEESNPLKEKKEAVHAYLIPGAVLAAGILIILILWRFGIFQKTLSGQTDWIKLAGTAVFFLAVSGYGAWRTMPDRRRITHREGMVSYEEEGNCKKVCLIPRKGKGEAIPVASFPYRLGRAEGKVNTVINDSGISQIHAQIFQEGGNIMVMDEESINGTYRNDERLVPWQKTLLRDGDLLRFAQSEYVVEITQSEYVI